jgi:hypothetical protein
MNKKIFVSLALAFFCGGALLSGCSSAKNATLSPSGMARKSVTLSHLKKIESDTEGFTYFGFSLIDDRKASKRVYEGTYEKGATARYSFRGDILKIYGYQGQKGGRFALTIDSVDKGTVDTHSSGDDDQALLASYSGLGDAMHEMSLTTLDEAWVAIDYLEIDIGKNTYSAHYDLAPLGEVVTSVPKPTGGGNKDLNVIRNERVYAVGTSGLGAAQYDSYDGYAHQNVFWMGYSFKETFSLSKLVLQTGDVFQDGGWWKNGSLKVQIFANDAWSDVTLSNDPAYPVGDAPANFTASGIYTFLFPATECSGIRLSGDAGGTSTFVAISQIEVFSASTATGLLEGADYRSAVVYEKEDPVPVTPTFGDFEITQGEAGTDYETTDTTLSTLAAGNFLAADSKVSSSYHLSATISENIVDNTASYGFVLNGSQNESGQLSGLLLRPYVNNGGLFLRIGYLNADVFSLYGDFDSQYSYNGTDAMKYDFYVENGTIAYRINDWAIATFDSVAKGTSFYFYAQKTALTLSALTLSDLEGNLANYAYRSGWGGNDHYTFTKTFKSLSHSFTMTLPSDLDKTAIESLALIRFGALYVAGQDADVTLNGQKLATAWASPSGQNFGDSIYEISKDAIASTSSLAFQIDATASGGEYCVGDYRLVYRAGAHSYLADALLLGVAESETSHAFSGTPSWSGYQKGFVNLANAQYLGFQAKGKTADMVLPTIADAQPISVTMSSADPISIDFLKSVTIVDNGSFSCDLILWLDKTQEASTSMSFENASVSTTYYIDMFVRNLDNSAANNCLKSTVSAALTITAYLA